MNIQHPVPRRAPTEDPQAPARGDPATRLGAGRGHRAAGRPGPGPGGGRGSRARRRSALRRPGVRGGHRGAGPQDPGEKVGAEQRGQEGDGERPQSPVTTASEATA